MFWQIRHELFGTHFAYFRYGNIVYIRPLRQLPNGNWQIKFPFDGGACWDFLSSVLIAGYDIKPITYNGEHP